MPEREREDAVTRDNGSSSERDGQELADGDDPSLADDAPVRRGSVDLRLRDGTRVHHDEAYVRYESDAFVVAVDDSFSEAATERYPKETVAWVEVRHPRR